MKIAVHACHPHWEWDSPPEDADGDPILDARPPVGALNDQVFADGSSGGWYLYNYEYSARPSVVLNIHGATKITEEQLVEALTKAGILTKGRGLNTDSDGVFPSGVMVTESEDPRSRPIYSLVVESREA